MAVGPPSLSRGCRFVGEHGKGWVFVCIFCPYCNKSPSTERPTAAQTCDRGVLWGGRPTPPPHSAKTKASAVPCSCLKSLGENASPRRFPFAKASRTPRRTGPSLFLQSRRYCTSPTLLCRRRSLRLCAQLGRFPGFKHLPWSRSGCNQMTQDTLPLQGHKLIMTPAKSSFPPKVTHHGFY